MDSTQYRVAIVGASSLAGKELSEEIGESQLAAADLVLLDEEEAAGQVTAMADEVGFIQRLDASSFERLDFVFFAGPRTVTRKYWQQAGSAAASIIDMTGTLEGEQDVVVRAPWVSEVQEAVHARQPELTTTAVVPAHTAALMLALMSARVKAKLGLKSVAAAVMEPASEYGRPAMDELHQQTVNLLSFQSLPREHYDAQVSFNLLPSLGEAATITLAETEQRIRKHFVAVTNGQLPQLALQMVQAPVFHGYAIAALIETAEDATTEEVEAALENEHFDIVSDGSDAPSNLSATGQEAIMVRVRADGDRRFWVWMAADNLKLAALNAIACAMELKRLRPRGKVQ